MSEQEVGRIYVSLDLKTDKFNQESKGAEEKSKSLKQTLNETAMAFTAMGLVAGIALNKISQQLKAAVKASTEYEVAVKGLNSVAQSTGTDMDDARKAAKSLAKDGLMNVSDASTTLKNLLMSGFNLPQAIKLMERFKDIASYNRQGTMAFGESIVSASVGIKNGNSILVDNMGLTKNLSMILKEAGFQETDLMNVRSDAAVRLALYNGMLSETAPFLGDAAEYAQTFAGRQQKLNQEIFMARVAIGDALKPALADMIKKIEPIVVKLKKWATDNPELVRTIAAVTTAALAAASALGVLGASYLFSSKAIIPVIRAANQLTTALVRQAAATLAAMGPIGWIIIGVIAVGAAIYVAYRKFEGFRKVVDQVGRWMRDVLWPAIQQVAKAVWDNLVVAFQWIAKVTVDAWVALKQFWDGVKGNVMQALVGFWKGIVGLFNAFLDFYGFLEGPLKTAFKGLWDAISNQLWPALQLLWNVISKDLWPALQEIWKLIVEQLWPALQDLASAVASAVMPVIRLLADLWTNVLVPAAKELWKLISDTLIPALKELMKTIRDALAPVLSWLADRFKDVLHILKKVWEFLSPYIVPALKILAKIIGAVVVVAFIAFIKVIEIVIRGVALLIKVFAVSLKTAIMVITPIIKALVWYFSNVMIPMWTLFYKAASFVWNAIAGYIHMVWNTIIKPIWDVISWYVSNVLVPVWKVLWEAAKLVWENISSKIETIWNNVIKPIWDLIWAYITNVLVPVWKKIFEIAREVWDNIYAKIQAVWDFIKPIWDAIWKYITETLVPAFQAIWDKVSDVFTKIWNKISGWIEDFKRGFGIVKEKIADIIDRFVEIKDKITDALSNVKDAIVKPFKEAFKWITDKVDDVKAALDKINPFHRNSPSLVDWIEKGTGKIKNLYGDMFSNLDGMSANSRGLLTASAQTVGSSISNQTSVSNAVTLNAKFETVVPPSRTQLRSAAQDLIDAANDIMRAKGQPEIGGGYIKGDQHG